MLELTPLSAQVAYNFPESARRLFFGPSPALNTIRHLDKFDLIINVSDEPGLTFTKTGLKPTCQTLWFPIAEVSMWPLATLDSILQAIDHSISKNLLTYIHCNAGACRAPTCLSLWKHSRGTYPLDTIIQDPDISCALELKQISLVHLQALNLRKHLPALSTESMLSESTALWDSYHHSIKT